MKRHEKVHVGETVHYVVDDPEAKMSDTWPHRCRAAVVTRIDDMERITLTADGERYGVSYADVPPGQRPPEGITTTRWWLSLLVINPDGSGYPVHEVPGPYRAELHRWHLIKDCAVPHWPDWMTEDERQANGRYED